MCLIVAYVAQTAGQHNRLVIAVASSVNVGFERAEISKNVGAAEFVVKRSAAERTFDHDLQRRSHAGGRPVVRSGLRSLTDISVIFPGLFMSRKSKRRDGKSG